MNKTIAIITFIAALLTTPLGTAHGQSPAEPADLVKVFLLDDQSGPELQTLHGIQPLKIDDLIDLVNAVIDGDTAVQLFHQPIDEDASNNPVTQMAFKPFASEPPVVPTANMPLREFAERVNKFNRDREEWRQQITEYGHSVVADAEAFVQHVATTQLQVADRFNRKLKARNGRDFSRSDIVGTLLTANRVLGNSGQRFLLANSDLLDEPAHRQSRKIPLTSTELDPGIELICVNTSHLPEQSPLLAGLSNKIRHADSIREAMALVSESLKPKTTVARSNAASQH